MKKRLVGLLVATCLLGSMMGILPVSAVDPAAVDFSDGFSDGLSKWNTSGLTNGATAEVVDDPVAENAGNKVLKIAFTGSPDGNKGVLTAVGLPATVDTGKFVMECRFYLPVNGSGVRPLTQVKFGVPLIAGPQSGIYYPTTTSTENKRAAFAQGKWQSYKVIYDLDADTMQVYVEGALAYSGEMTESVKPRFDYAYGVSTDVGYFDDIKMYVPTGEISLVSSTLQDGATGVELNPSVTLTFSDEIEASTAAAISLTGEGVSAQPTLAAPIVMGDTVILNVEGTLEGGKRYTLDISGVQNAAGSTPENGTISFTTSTEGRMVYRMETFEGYTTGQIHDGGTTLANEPTKTIDGTTYVLGGRYNSDPAPDKSGAFRFITDNSNLESNLVTTDDGAGGTTQALQLRVLADEKLVNNPMPQFQSVGSTPLTATGRFVYKARVRNGGPAGEEGEAGYTALPADQNGFSKAPYGFMLLTFPNQGADARQNVVLQETAEAAGLGSTSMYFNETLPANGTWFDLAYEVDIPTSTVSVYIDGQLVASRRLPGKYTDATNFLGTSGARWGFAWCTTNGRENALYLDNISLETYDVREGIQMANPVFRKADGSIISGIQAGTITATVNVVNRTDAATPVTVVGVLRKDGVLLDCVATKLAEDLAVGATSEDITLTFTVPEEDGPYEIDLYTWKDLTSITPLYDRYLFAESGRFIQSEEVTQ